jgi:hypothetical protein
MNRRSSRGLSQYSLISTTSTIRVCGPLPTAGDASCDEYTARCSSQICFRFANVVELEVDHDIVRIVGGLEDPVAAHTRACPIETIVVEGGSPSVVVGNRVFDLQDVHPSRSLSYA